MTEYSQDRFGLPVAESSAYAFIITHVNTGELGADMAAEVGTLGPRNASDAQIAALEAGEGHMFRMLDDDGVWYYRGRIVFDDDSGPITASAGGEYFVPGTWLAVNLTEDGFGPLWDFGAPNAGCTEIQYRCVVPAPGAFERTTRVWATL